MNSSLFWWSLLAMVLLKKQEEGIGRYKKNDLLPGFIQGHKEADMKFVDLNDDLYGRRMDIRMRGRKLWTKDTIVTQADDTVPVLRKIYKDTVKVQEKFVALFLNQRNEIIGYYEHTLGGISATFVDIQLFTAAALKVLAKSVIISHNHPSGNLSPSQADKNITKQLKDALGYFNIQLLDHIIITEDDYMAFSSKGLI